MARVAIVGPGAIGLTIGAALMQAGHDVIFCGRQTFPVVNVTKRGASAVCYPARVASALQDRPAAGAADWAFLCVKAHQAAGAAPWLAGFGRIAVLMNGVEHREIVAPLVPPATDIVPVIVDLPAARRAPGVAEWHSRANLTVAQTPSGEAFCRLFAGSFAAAAADADFLTRAWKKLCVNAPGAILALTGQTMGVFRKPGIADVARAVLRECVAVGRAEGAKLDDGLIETQMAAFLAEAPENGNSIYADRMASRAMEWDARNGVIVRKGAVHGIPTPVNATLTPLLAALDP